VSKALESIVERLAFLPLPSRSFSRFGRIGIRTIAPARWSSSIRSRWIRCCSFILTFRVAWRTARGAGFGSSHIPAMRGGGTYVVRSAAGGTIAGSVPASEAPRTTGRAPGKRRRSGSMPAGKAAKFCWPRRRPRAIRRGCRRTRKRMPRLPARPGPGRPNCGWTASCSTSRAWPTRRWCPTCGWS